MTRLLSPLVVKVGVSQKNSSNSQCEKTKKSFCVAHGWFEGRRTSRMVSEVEAFYFTRLNGFTKGTTNQLFNNLGNFFPLFKEADCVK